MARLIECRRVRDPAWWHLPLLFCVSAGYESLFIHHGFNPFDEGWPLYAAMQLHAGGTLYDDVFFVFPPGHLLAAWLGIAWDPPGITAARAVYAAFDVALCLALYLLGRRLVAAPAALAAAGLVAIAARYSHLSQFLFGYRYLVWSVLALLALSQRQRSGDPRWLVASGACLGAALCFRLTPAFAGACGVAAGIAAGARSWRGALADAAWLALGGVLVVAPVLAWFGASVGLPTLWHEVAVRPVAMTEHQSLRIPSLSPPAVFRRNPIERWFTAIQYRLYGLLYAGYAVWLAVAAVRAVRGRRPLDDPLLAATAVWGGVFFLRTLGRSDTGHLQSAIPPVCLLGVCALQRARAAAARRLAPGLASRTAGAVLWSAVFAVWVVLQGSDRALDRRHRGAIPIQVLRGEISVERAMGAAAVDWNTVQVLHWSEPGDTVLDLSRSPLLHVLTGRRGPGYRDVVIPGTFLSEAEERAFVARLERDPPALVLLSLRPFDDVLARSLGQTAPLLTKWVLEHYEERAERNSVRVLVHRGRAGDPGPPAGAS